MGNFTQNIRQISRNIFSGEAINYAFKHRNYLIFFFVLALIYISNGLIFGLELSKAKKLESQLIRCKAKYHIRLDEVTKLRYPYLLELLKKNNLEDLEISTTPPVKVEKNEIETKR